MCPCLQISSKQNYVRCAYKFSTYGYTLFKVQQKHIKKLPAKVLAGINYKGITIFRIDDKRPIAQVSAPCPQPWW